MKLLTLEDYTKAGEEFFPKYYYVMGEMGEGAKPEDVLKVMEAVGGLALKMRLEEDDEVVLSAEKAGIGYHGLLSRIIRFAFNRGR